MCHCLKPMTIYVHKDFIFTHQAIENGFWHVLMVEEGMIVLSKR